MSPELSFDHERLTIGDIVCAAAIAAASGPVRIGVRIALKSY
jgi:hypothetical protein